MITREIKQHELADADFAEERENTFFLPPGQEVLLHCRFNRTQRRTYVSERDYRRLPVKQQAAFQANPLNPRCFYADTADAVLHAPAAPATAARKSTARRLAASPSKPRGTGSRGLGRPFSLESETAQFAVDELEHLDGYKVELTPNGVRVFNTSTGDRMDRASVLALKTKLDLDRGIAVPAGGRRSSSIRLRVA